MPAKTFATKDLKGSKTNFAVFCTRLLLHTWIITLSASALGDVRSSWRSCAPRSASRSPSPCSGCSSLSFGPPRSVRDLIHEHGRALSLASSGPGASARISHLRARVDRCRPCAGGNRLGSKSPTGKSTQRRVAGWPAARCNLHRVERGEVTAGWPPGSFPPRCQYAVLIFRAF